MLQIYVSSVSDVFRRMLQMFHLNVSKIDRWPSTRYLGVAHVSMAIYVCFKCFICFRLMMQMFHLDVSKVDRMLQAVVRQLLLLRHRRGSRAGAGGLRGVHPQAGRWVWGHGFSMRA
jgi:hypothetical protein